MTITITIKLPNLTKSFEKLQLILDLEQKANPNTITGQAILKAIKGKEYSADEILSYVKDQAGDCFKTMTDCIGSELTNRILNYKP